MTNVSPIVLALVLLTSVFTSGCPKEPAAQTGTGAETTAPGTAPGQPSSPAVAPSAPSAPMDPGMEHHDQMAPGQMGPGMEGHNHPPGAGQPGGGR
jgi:PBP1b-binding outer membrane lipoprotein LpoB